MNDTNHPASTDHNQWFQYYQQAAVSDPPVAITASTGHGFSDATTTKVTTSFVTNNTSSPSNSTSIGNNIDHAHLNPQPVVAKPIRRRSRASRRTPTTLLNASTTNFRSLVQQFTGCQNTKATSLGSQKGPVNLSFGMPPKNQINDHQMIGTTSRISPLGYNFYNQSTAPVIEEQQWQQQQQNQEMYGKQQINGNMVISGGLDEFGIGDVSDLQELMDESSSFSTGDNKRDGRYYF